MAEMIERNCRQAGRFAEGLRQMARNVLSDRFQLKVHIETVDTDVLELVTDKKGLKIKESPRGVVTSEQRFNGRLEATHYGIANLVHRLNQELNRKVIDGTGLTGFYDLKLEWTPESSALAGSDDSTAPSIFTAVQTQPGLKLELRKKYPIDTLIIDRAEKPTGNGSWALRGSILRSAKFKVVHYLGTPAVALNPSP